MPKFSLTFKTPDVMDQIEVGVREDVKNKKKFREDDETEEMLEEEEDEVEARLEHISITVYKYVKDQEYITIEFDTDADTATVVEARQ